MSRQLGKIGLPLFDETIAGKRGYNRPEVRMGPAFGVDVSLVDLPQGLAMALTSDPLSFIPSLGLEASAWLSVHLMANDMATTGHAPMYGQFVLNLPDTMTSDDFKQYWTYIHRFSADIGIAITGGHTGFTEYQKSTISGGGTLITIAPRDQLLTADSARAGDVILVTKQCALSSVAILAMSFPRTVRDRVGKELYEEACASFYRTSSLPDALIATGNSEKQEHGISAMHDVTEGGVLGAIYELAVASGLGVRVDSEKLPVSPVQRAVCGVFGLDYRYVIGAGSMIIASGKDSAVNVISRLHAAGIPCVEVGELTDRVSGINLFEKGMEQQLPYHGEDPYWAAFYEAMKKGWK